MTNRFENKTIIITGAGSGIGLSAAKQAIAEGAKVVAVDLSAERLDAAAAEIGAAYIPVAIDITAADAPEKILAAAGGKVDVLVNNAGIMDGFLPAAEVDDKTWDLILNVNLTAPFKLIRAVLPGMIEAGKGAIVNISSEASLRPCSGVAYAVSKRGINALTQHVATLYRGKGIRCNAVVPGAVKTNVDGAFRSAYAPQVLGPLLQAGAGTPAEPEELAAAILFLADDVAASNINGVILPCDGGWSAV
ncbi:MAG: SDR family NAD(P)-dependent oxidoreductase [Propionibacteriaceae bacterium]|jgi:NAD(P)-dependent dehydrogenase (short-subunit alcohol dehydrogenase family)|nr:SDR family NAD(P)-dependent oxidoreductase [Propionibacteriaceae bacterium]